MHGLLDPAVAERLALAQAGADPARHLEAASLLAGDVGVLTVAVCAVAPARAFRRRNGSEGLLARVTLADATGEVDLVLWDDETRLLASPEFQPGTCLVLRGAQVRAGRQGGVELGLGSALVERVSSPPSTDTLAGRLRSLGETHVGPERILSAHIELETTGGVVRGQVTGPLILALRAQPLDNPIVLHGVGPHPLLAGWFLASPSATLAADTPK